MGSVSNPKIARHELMVRMRGFEDLANEMGLVGMFYTLTAPSKYHATHVHSGQRNDKYQHASPRQTQKYLCKVWARVRTNGAAKAFVHLVFVLLNLITMKLRTGTYCYSCALKKLVCNGHFRKHALKEDGNEKGASEHRFTVKPIDEEFGSATGYIAKYISKNIDGYGMDGDLDFESGKPVREMAKRVRARASRWNIRQFQQIGGAPLPPARIAPVR